jgi:hypothetical protein
MSKVALSGNALGTGTVTLASPNTNSTVTLNLPAVNGTLNTSGAVNEVPAGTVSAPAITTTGDTNTGIFFPAADTIAFTEGGVESMRIDASGNVGVGVTPSAWGSGWSPVQFSGEVAVSRAGISRNAYYDGSSYRYITTGNATLMAQSSGQFQWFNAPSGTAGNIISFTQAMTLNASGSLLVGASNDNGRATFSGAVGFAGNGITIFENSSGNNRRLRLYQNTNEVIYDATAGIGSNAHVWYIAGSEVARLNTSGNLLVGTTGLLSGMSGQFAVGNDRQVSIDSFGGDIKIRGNAGGWATGTYFIGNSGTFRGGFGSLGSLDTLSYYWVGTAFNGTGVQLSYGGTSWATLSDEREKNIYGVIDNALDKILQFDGVYFNYKSDKPEQRRRVGFSAQKVQAAFPEAVEELQREIDNPTEETKRLTLSATEIIPLLVQAVKELTARLEVLENK